MKNLFIRIIKSLRILDGKDGFSLAEVMVAAGLIGALSLVMMKLTENQAVTQKRAESSFEINTISNIISQNLLVTEACSATLGVGTAVVDNAVITNIRNRKGNVLFNTTNKYGNRQIKINAMTIDDVTINSGAGTNQYGELNLLIQFEKLSKVLSGNKLITKKFPVNVEVDSSGNLVKCYSSTENAVRSAKEEACSDLGGVFIEATDKCNLTTYSLATPVSDSDAVSTQHLLDFYNDKTAAVLDPRYVNTTGDTMTGKLTVNADVETSTKVCVGSKCRNFAQSPCPTGQVARTIEENGTVSCANITCPPNTYFNGINAAGSPTCTPLPTETCPVNEYVSEVKPDGTIVCKPVPNNATSVCPVGQYIQAINSGVPTCAVDRSVYGKKCSGYGLSKGFDSNGNQQCANPTISFNSCAWSDWTLWCSAGYGYFQTAGGCPANKVATKVETRLVDVDYGGESCNYRGPHNMTSPETYPSHRFYCCSLSIQ